jgi:hypothetical protein
MDVVQMALRFGVMPSQIENEDVYWINRALLYFEAENEASKMN